MSWQEERARRRRARDMERRLAELDDLDRRHGLGTDPAMGRPPARRRSGGFPSCLSSLLIFVAVLAVGGYLLTPGAPSLSDLRALAERLLDADASPGGQTYDDGVDGEGGDEGYSFAQTQRDGVSPATWSCEATIPVEVNPQGAPAGYQDLVGSAVSRLNQASTFTFELTGETDDRDFFARGPGPVLLGFADASEVEQLTGPVAGLGGAVYSQRLGGELTAVGGMVVLDTEVFDDSLPAEYGEATIIHELAHVLGLGHTDQRGELMQAASVGQTEMGPGDREGLAALEQEACS